MFSREQHDNMVSVLPYFLSMLATSFPFAVIMPIIFSSIYYWMTGLRPEWDAFLWFTLCVLYVHHCACVVCRVVCVGLTCLFFPALRSTWLNRWDSCSSHSRGPLRPLRSRPTPSCPSGIFVHDPPNPRPMHHPHFSLSLIADRCSCDQARATSSTPTRSSSTWRSLATLPICNTPTQRWPYATPE